MTSMIDLYSPLSAQITLRSTRDHTLSVLNFVTMSPNSTAKNKGQRIIIPEDKPKAGMIEKDGPLVDSPVAIDSEERDPGGPPEDVRGLRFTLTFLSISTSSLGSTRPSLARHTPKARLQMRAPIVSAGWILARQTSRRITITLSRVFDPNRSHHAVRFMLKIEARERVRTYGAVYLYPAPCRPSRIFTVCNPPHPGSIRFSR